MFKTIDFVSLLILSVIMLIILILFFSTKHNDQQNSPKWVGKSPIYLSQIKGYQILKIEDGNVSCYIIDLTNTQATPISISCVKNDNSK